MKKRLIAGVLLIVMVIGLVGCGAQKADTKLAHVNDTIITRGQLDQMVALYAFLNNYDQSQLTNSYRQTMLQDLVDLEAAKQYFIANGKALPETFEAERQSFIDTAHENAEQVLTEQGVTDDFLGYFFELQSYAGMLVSDVSAEMKNEDFEVKAKAYYDDHQEEFTQEPQVHASHILVETEEEAQDLLNKINEGQDFAQLAIEFSKDGSAASGGDLGFFTKDRMVPEFGNAAFALQPGEVSDIVKTEYGYHIIKCTDVKAGGQASYEDSKDEIYETLYFQMLDEKIAEIQEGMDTEVGTVK